MERIIGREKELREVLGHIRKGRHTLLVGDVGCGKSAILKEAYRCIEKEGGIRIIYITQLSPSKDMLLSVMHQLHEKYKALRLPGLPNASRLKWEEVKQTVEKMKVKDLTFSILRCLSKHDYILMLDELSKVTPAVKVTIELFMDKACLVSSIVPELMKKSLDMKRLYWRFHKVRIKNLSKDSALRLIERLCSELGIVAEDYSMLKNRLLRASRGNPLMIEHILTSGALDEFYTKESIRKIDLIDHAGTRYIDHTPLLLLGGALVMMLRYASLGLADRSMYVLAGTGMALFMVIRFFVYRGMRR